MSKITIKQTLTGGFVVEGQLETTEAVRDEVKQMLDRYLDGCYTLDEVTNELLLIAITAIRTVKE